MASAYYHFAMLWTRHTAAATQRHTRRFICNQTVSVKTFRFAAHVALGASVFIAADAGISYLLRRNNIGYPSSVLCIIGFGMAVMHPRTGSKIFAALGPGAMILRGCLPMCLCGGLIAPLGADIPDVEGARVLLLVAIEFLGTLVTTAFVVYRVLDKGFSPSTSAPTCTTTPLGDGEPSSCPHLERASKTRIFHSPRLGLGLLGCAILTTSIYHQYDAMKKKKVGRASKIFCTAFAIDDRYRVMPYVCATAGLLILANKYTPKRIASVIPPLLVAGASLGAGLWALGGKDEVDMYKRHALPWLYALVGPAIGTLGLFVHTHRSVFRSSWKPLIMVSVCAAPLGIVLTAAAGNALEIPSNVVASVIPATTTLGLAIAMAPTLHSHHGANRDFIVLGPLAFGVCGMVTWPLLIRLRCMSRLSRFSQGFCIGSVSHIIGMTSLMQAGRHVSADAAAIAFFLLGTFRCVLLELPVFHSILHSLIHGTWMPQKRRGETRDIQANLCGSAARNDDDQWCMF